jgi:hypothetical protein
MVRKQEESVVNIGGSCIHVSSTGAVSCASDNVINQLEESERSDRLRSLPSDTCDETSRKIDSSALSSFPLSRSLPQSDRGGILRSVVSLIIEEKGCLSEIVPV